MRDPFVVVAWFSSVPTRTQVHRAELATLKRLQILAQTFLRKYYETWRIKFNLHPQGEVNENSETQTQESPYDIHKPIRDLIENAILPFCAVASGEKRTSPLFHLPRQW